MNSETKAQKACPLGAPLSSPVRNAEFVAD